MSYWKDKRNPDPKLRNRTIICAIGRAVDRNGIKIILSWHDIAFPRALFKKEEHMASTRITGLSNDLVEIDNNRIVVFKKAIDLKKEKYPHHICGPHHRFYKFQ